MIQRRSLGPGALVVSLVVGTLMMIVTAMTDAGPNAVPADRIALFPGPVDWGLPYWWNVLAGGGVLLALALGMQMLNKRYDFIPGTDVVCPGMVYLLCASVPSISGGLCGSMLVGVAALCSLALVMGCYRKPNSTQEIFVAATVISVGTMCDWACLAPAVWCLPAWAIMKTLHFREIVAFLLGLVAPWWCVFGLGLAPVSLLIDFRPPLLVPTLPPPSELPILIGATAWWAFLALLIGLNAAVKLYAGNPRVRRINNVINLLAFISIVAMAVDYGNFAAYLITFFLTVAVQLSQLFALWSIPRRYLWFTLLTGAMIAQYILLITL